MVDGAAKRREYYLAKIQEAEKIAAKSTSLETINQMQLVIEG